MHWNVLVSVSVVVGGSGNYINIGISSSDGVGSSSSSSSSNSSSSNSSSIVLTNNKGGNYVENSAINGYTVLK